MFFLCCVLCCANYSFFNWTAAVNEMRCIFGRSYSQTYRRNIPNLWQRRLINELHVSLPLVENTYWHHKCRECFMCEMCLWVASDSRDDERTQRFNDSLHSLMRLQIGFVKFKLDLVNALLFSKFSYRNFSMITHLGSKIKSAADHWFFFLLSNLEIQKNRVPACETWGHTFWMRARNCVIE